LNTRKKNFVKRQSAIKTGNLLAKYLSHSYGKNLALPCTMQINSGTVPLKFTCLLGCIMTRMAPSDSCSFAPDINTLTYIPCWVLDEILHSPRTADDWIAQP